MAELEIMDPTTGDAVFTRDCGHIELLHVIMHEHDGDGQCTTAWENPETYPCAICWEENYPKKDVAGVTMYMAHCMACMKYAADVPTVPSHMWMCDECKEMVSDD
jgi:hypothetical protein